MAITHPTALRNAVANLVADSLDVGGAGSLIYETSGSAEVATLTFSATAFGDAANGTITANGITADSSATGGTLARFRMVDGNDAAAGFSGSIAVSGGDITASELSVGAGATVTLSSLSYTAMP